jgi:fused signal recognition particle receptor
VQKIRRVLQRADPAMPHETLLVIDGVTGQNGLLQARGFHDAMGLTGVVLTKLDGTAKGGVVVAVKRELGVSVRLVGVGEELEDLQDFQPAVFVDEILGDLAG